MSNLYPIRVAVTEEAVMEELNCDEQTVRRIWPSFQLWLEAELQDVVFDILRDWFDGGPGTLSVSMLPH